MKLLVTLPPFDGDDEAMLAWLDQQITLELEKQFTGPRASNADTERFLAKQAWRRGKPEWLRSLYPEIAECIVPYRDRSTKPFKPVSNEQVAYGAAKRIRAIWREHFPGRVRHQPHDAVW